MGEQGVLVRCPAHGLTKDVRDILNGVARCRGGIGYNYPDEAIFWCLGFIVKPFQKMLVRDENVLPNSKQTFCFVHMNYLLFICDIIYYITKIQKIQYFPTKNVKLTNITVKKTNHVLYFRVKAYIEEKIRKCYS